MGILEFQFIAVRKEDLVRWTQQTSKRIARFTQSWDSKQSWELTGECSTSLRKSCGIGGAHIMLLGMGYGKEGVEDSEKTGLPPRGKS